MFTYYLMKMRNAYACVTSKNQASHEPTLCFLINSKNLNHTHILLTETDPCSSKLSRYLYFEK